MGTESTTAKPTVDTTFTLWIVYINVVLYATCYQIQRPLEPFMVEKLNLVGDSSDEYAKLQSFFSVMQTIGSLISGVFLDKFGVKGGFIISFLASAASYALLSQSTTLNILYLSKIPTIFQAGFLCAQLAASQVTTDGAERVAALGRLTMSYTIGSIIGPTVGGFLGANGDYYLGAKLAVAGSLLSVVLTLFMPSITTTNVEIVDDEVLHTAEPNEKIKGSDKKVSSGTSNVPVLTVISLVWLFLGTKVITSVANSMGAAALPLILKNIYGLNEQNMGFSLSFNSVFNAIVNGALLGPIVHFFGGNLSTLIEVCISAMAILSAIQAAFALPSYASLSLANGLIEFLALTIALSMFQYVLSTTITSESTTRVGPKAKGTLLGLEHALFALARIASPQAGVALLKSGGVTAVSGVCSGVFALVWLIWKLCADRFNRDSKIGESCLNPEPTERKGK